MEHELLYPVALNLRGRDCVVIGRRNDCEAAQKAAGLDACGANVRRLYDPATIQERDLAQTFFVISTVKDAELSLHLQRLSEKHRFLLCCLDQPEFGFVSMTAIARSGPVQLSISTSGAAPSISKAFRKGLLAAMDTRFASFVDQLAAFRRRLREQMPARDDAARRVSTMIDASRGFDVTVSFSYPEWFGATGSPD